MFTSFKDAARETLRMLTYLSFLLEDLHEARHALWQAIDKFDVENLDELHELLAEPMVRNYFWLEDIGLGTSVKHIVNAKRQFEYANGFWPQKEMMLTIVKLALKERHDEIV